jgi:hypothetical protein
MTLLFTIGVWILIKIEITNDLDSGVVVNTGDCSIGDGSIGDGVTLDLRFLIYIIY